MVKLNKSGSNLVFAMQQLSPSAFAKVINQCKKEVCSSNFSNLVGTLKVHMNKLKRRMIELLLNGSL